MRPLITVVIFLSTVAASAQLYVSTNSYVYAKNQVLFVNQAVNLQTDGHLYLRNESQLMQGNATVASTNQGEGKLSVFQEGTTNNFNYNYWCSPVGEANAVTGNSAFGITMLHRPTGLTASTANNPLPVGVLNGTAVPFRVASGWIYKFVNLNAYSQWVLAAAGISISAGEGFTMKGSNNLDAVDIYGDNVLNNPATGAQRYDFRGKPNNGNISIAVGVGNMTLTGNPYPSALDVCDFLLDPTNTAIEATAYYWEQKKSVSTHFLAEYEGGYGTFVPVSTLDGETGYYVAATFDTYDNNGDLNVSGGSSGLVIERRYAPVGQGFMVEGKANSTVTLKNSHRNFYKESEPLSQFEREDNPTTISQFSENISASNGRADIRINAIMNNRLTRQIGLLLLPNATDGVDRGIDGKSPVDASLPNDFYFFLDNDRYVVEGVSFDVSKRIPVGVKAGNNTTFRFQVAEINNIEAGQPVYIYDAKNNSYHNIRTGNYDVTLDAGVYNNRFEITFTDAALSVGQIDGNSFEVLQNNTSQMLEISNPNGVELKSCSLYDMSGKLIFSQLKLGSESNYSFSTSGISEGVYIVKLLTADNQDFGKKVSVFRKQN